MPLVTPPLRDSTPPLQTPETSVHSPVPPLHIEVGSGKKSEIVGLLSELGFAAEIHTETLPFLVVCNLLLAAKYVSPALGAKALNLLCIETENQVKLRQEKFSNTLLVGAFTSLTSISRNSPAVNIFLQQFLFYANKSLASECWFSTEEFLQLLSVVKTLSCYEEVNSVLDLLDSHLDHLTNSLKMPRETFVTKVSDYLDSDVLKIFPAAGDLVFKLYLPLAMNRLNEADEGFDTEEEADEMRQAPTPLKKRKIVETE